MSDAEPPTQPTPPVLGGLPPQATPPPYQPPPHQPAAPPSRSSTGRTLAVVAGLVVVGLLVVGGVLAAVVVLSGSGGDLEVTIEDCSIAADGTLGAAGSVRSSGDGGTVEVEVRYTDVETGEQVDTATTSMELPADAAQRWTLDGSAGDDVQRVTCDVTARR